MAASAGELEERAVALVGLHHEPLAVVVRGVGADLVDVATDEEASAASPRRAARARASTTWWSCRGSRRRRCRDGWRRARATPRPDGAPGSPAAAPPRSRGSSRGSRWTPRPRRARARRSPPSCPTRASMPAARSRASARESLRSEPDTVWPMRARTTAIALIPAPPMPTTWIRRGAPRSRRFGSAVTGRLLHQVGDPRRGVGAGEGRGGRAHRGEAGRVRQQRVELRGEAGTVALGVGDEDGGPGRDEGPAVGRLVVARARRGAGPPRPGSPRPRARRR